MFTIDKVVGSVVKQVQTILADTKSVDLFDQLRREREIPRPTTQQLINFRRAAEKILGPDENLFRMVWVCASILLCKDSADVMILQVPESKIVTIQLLGKDDASFDDSEVQTGRWQAYMDSYVSVCTFFSDSDTGVQFLPAWGYRWPDALCDTKAIH